MCYNIYEFEILLFKGYNDLKTFQNTLTKILKLNI